MTYAARWLALEREISMDPIACGLNEVVRKADWEAWPKTDYAFDSDVAQLKEELERQKGEPDAKG